MSRKELCLCVNVDLIVLLVPRDIRVVLEKLYGCLRLCFGLPISLSVPFAHPLDGHSIRVEQRQPDECVETVRSHVVGFPQNAQHV